MITKFLILTQAGVTAALMPFGKLELGLEIGNIIMMPVGRPDSSKEFQNFY